MYVPFDAIRGVWVMEKMIKQNTLELWFESVQGTVDGQIVHMGERAVFYPDRNCVLVERWGPDKKAKEEILIPKEIKEKLSVIEYLNRSEVHIPFDVIC